MRAGDHPDDAIPIFPREVERLIETKNNRSYADAVALMDHVRELLGQLAGRVGSRRTPRRSEPLTSRSETS